MSQEMIEGFQLSPQQEHLGLLQRVDKGSIYQAFCAIRIEGRIDISHLEAALQDVVNRHEIFRTYFPCIPGMTLPVQVITDSKVSLEFLADNAEDKKNVSFDLPSGNLEQSPLFHACLVSLSGDKYLLRLQLPALCADAVTLHDLVREIGQSYSAILRGDVRSDEPLQYADFSEWQNELLNAEETEIGREYWRGQDFSARWALKLPYDSPSLETAPFEPEFISLAIAPNSLAKLEALAQKYQTSIATVLLTCWQTLLWRLTGQSEIIIGTGCDGRNYQELKGALGLFAKYLPVRCCLAEDLRFSQVLQQVDESVAQIKKWQDCFSWDYVTESDEPGVEVSFCPLCFEFEDKFIAYVDDDVNFSIDELYTCIDRFRIKLSCRQRDDALITEFHYDANHLCAEDIQRLAEQFHQLVDSATNHPEATISELNILSDRARNQLLVEFNQTQADYPQDKCIHHLIEEQAERTPNSIAVAFEDQQLTYAQLNQKANQLAHYLQQLGVKPDVLVGICVERSLEMVIGILGILKAGGAYVPLDPTYPQERLSFILEDTQTSVVLTQQRLIDHFPQHNTHIICLDNDWEAITQESKSISIPPLLRGARGDQTLSKQDCFPPEMTGENLAYIIYTSGSTGKPKGVQITHRNLVHSTSARLTYYQEPVTRFLLLSSFAFDSSIAGIFWTLCQGGMLYLPPEGLQRDVPQLIELIAKQHISHLLSLPSLYSLVLEQAKPEQLTSLRTIIVAGESCPKELVQRHLDLKLEASLFNEYGPTEGTVWTSVYHCQSPERRTQVPIGRPIANTQIYLLDAHLHPVPIGVVGELYISGDGLARGYLNQPEMTEQRFIPNPFSHTSGARLYKTGDLARYLPDGNIEFIGRIDNQVKIRGFRVELGEIETALSQHPGVRESVVLARDDVPGDKRLIVYIVPNRESIPTISQLRNFLKKVLPEYMIPSAFVWLKELPLTPNGKVNRRGLPAPDQVRPEITGVFVAPRTPVEEKLVKIWAELLKIERVGIHDNFFELGGHSLLTTQLLAKVRDTFQADVSLRQLLEVPTVAGLAENIEKVYFTESSTRLSSKTVIDLNAEAILDSSIYPETFGELVTEPVHILLTGATGFLGAFLLHELLQQTQATIYCLVRCQTLEDEQKKLQRSLEGYLLWNESLRSRIIPVVGNLSEPLLGLSEEQFQRMARQIDVIYHNGAWVHHVYPYSVLKATNVLGTQEVLRLACKTKAKPVHFISASSVFSAVGDSGVKIIREQDSLDENNVPTGGYSQSKWVAEKLIETARERGLPVCFYRPSRISGHSQTGIFNPHDFLYKLIIGCIQFGSVPDEDIRENIVPVDYVSRAIVHLSRQKESIGKAFHLVNPQILHSSQLIDQIRSLGYPLEQLSYDQWRTKLLNTTQGSSEHPLYALVPFFPARDAEAETSNSGVLQFDGQNTLAGLAGTSITCPPVDHQLLNTYLAYLLNEKMANKES
ncbi:non-ribosomal peptide synthetase family protein [Coleofasciculus sp. E2-BRE-01]|uniref:non-ribosomal peptide synthetase family protein n=1 Tax=Coleofasciculus sp. E2-BRE-01 TaxID=3069524 RepID=UPI0032FAD245